MKLTPLDIRHQEFGGALSGYQRKAVRAFLADAADAFERLLRDNLDQQERLFELERRVEAYRAGEDELRRTLVSAERLTSEMRTSASREVELIVREAEAERDRILGDPPPRPADLEAQYAARTVELESQYGARFATLEAQYAARASDLEQNYLARAAALEHEATVRRTALESSLARLKAERAQFLAQYRSLLAGFAELARQHKADLEDEAELGALTVPDVPTIEVKAAEVGQVAPVGPDDQDGQDDQDDQGDRIDQLPEFSHSL